jgi:tetratricopeptide (TPR) repeat protein
VLAVPRPSTDALLAGGLGALLAAVALKAGGGLRLGPLTTVEIGLQLAGGALVGAAVVADDGRRRHGALAVALMAALVVLNGLSIVWSVNTSDTWLEANRTLMFAAVFAAGVALVRIAGDRWAALLGATVIAAVVVCGYALLTKVFPGALNPDETYARLREPFGYWNAVGLAGALGVPGCLWLGARRAGHAALNALAYPALGLLLVTILLAYSRGALLAAALGCAFWFVAVPLRLRGAAVLGTSAAGALLVAAWVFGQSPLSEDRIALGLRSSSGHELGLALVAMIIGLLAAGMAMGFVAARRAPTHETRRRTGAAMLVALACVPLAVTVALTFSDRGLGGSISHGWNALTDPHASTPPNEPGRLTAVGSVRARYWNEALKIFEARPVVGAGAGGYGTARPQFREDTLDVRHAHGYVVQTLADLGLIGLAVSLALLAAWLAAAAKATGLAPGARAPRDYPPERIGLLSLAAIVIVFGVHSFVDWTWFVPGNAVVAMLCAGWVAGRGWTTEPPAAFSGLRERLRNGARTAPRAAGAAAVAVVTLAAAWATYQPLRSVHAGNDALEELEAKRLPAAREAAQRARDINPLAIDPLFELAQVETTAGNVPAARAALQEAVQLQPSNPRVWLQLAEFELGVANGPRAAIDALGPVLQLDPRSRTGTELFLEANRQAAAAATRRARRG